MGQFPDFYASIMSGPNQCMRYFVTMSLMPKILERGRMQLCETKKLIFCENIKDQSLSKSYKTAVTFRIT